MPLVAPPNNAAGSKGADGRMLGKPKAFEAPTSIEQGCERYAQSWCHGNFTCAASFEKETNYNQVIKENKDESECVATTKATCQVKASMTESGWTLPAMTSCLQATESERERCNLWTPQACMVKGTAAKGKGCVYDEQCASGVCIGSFNGVSCGTCAGTLQVGQEGCDKEPCAKRDADMNRLLRPFVTFA